MNESERDRLANEEHRRAARHQINLQGSVLITAINNSAEDNKSDFILQGQLRDVSMSGLGLIIPFEDMVELKMLGEDVTLRLLLPLPVQAIELDATPVRYLPSGEDELHVLMGAQITDMNGRDRIVFMEFIHGFDMPGNAETINYPTALHTR